MPCRTYKPATLADWRKMQIAQLKAQHKRSSDLADIYTKQAADASALIESLKRARLKSRVKRQEEDHGDYDKRHDAKAKKAKHIPWQHRSGNKAKVAKWLKSMAKAKARIRRTRG